MSHLLPQLRAAGHALAQATDAMTSAAATVELRPEAALPELCRASRAALQAADALDALVRETLRAIAPSPSEAPCRE